MIGFGGSSCSELSAMDMMNMETNRKFLSLPLNNNNSSGSDHRRVPVTSNSIAQDPHYNSHHNSTDTNCSVRDKIMAHPLFPRLLSSYLNCLKVINSELFLHKCTYIFPFLLILPTYV